MVEDIYVEFSLMRKTGQSEIAAAQVADDRVDGIGTKQKIELGVQGMA